MRKKKVLFIYPSLDIGGSTTSLLSLLNLLDKNEYDIDLQLYKNEGALLDVLPSSVNLLPAAQNCWGEKGHIAKAIRFIVKGYWIKAIFRKLFKKHRLVSPVTLGEFKAKELSRKSVIEYDYAIGYLEGWSDKYLAYSVKAKQKVAWLHSTFANITNEPHAEVEWIKRVDRIVFVAENCREGFVQTLPEMADKATVIENITDSDIIRNRAEMIDLTDVAYKEFSEAEVFKIITVCRLDINTKGLDRIVSCAKQLKDSGRTFLWYIVGDGDDREQIRELISRAELEDCLCVIGKRMNPYPFIKESDVMCMPSRYEGKPMVVTESMILGTPPVVTEYLSAHEQIEHGVDGLVAKNEDESIYSVLVNLMDHPELCLTMKENLFSRDYGNSYYIKEIEENLLGWASDNI